MKLSGRIDISIVFLCIVRIFSLLLMIPHDSYFVQVTARLAWLIHSPLKWCVNQFIFTVKYLIDINILIGWADALYDQEDVWFVKQERRQRAFCQARVPSHSPESTTWSRPTGWCGSARDWWIPDAASLHGKPGPKRQCLQSSAVSLVMLMTLLSRWVTDVFGLRILTCLLAGFRVMLEGPHVVKTAQTWLWWQWMFIHPGATKWIRSPQHQPYCGIKNPLHQLHQLRYTQGARLPLTGPPSVPHDIIKGRRSRVPPFLVLLAD